ncbi:MAG: hypothetical protein AB1765_02890 [Candidatus Hydrogenedentota bacterium]
MLKKIILAGLLFFNIALTPSVSFKTIHCELNKIFKIGINHPPEGITTELILLETERIKFEKKEYDESYAKDIYYFLPLETGKTTIGFKNKKQDGTVIEELRYEVIICYEGLKETKVKDYERVPECFPFIVYSSIDNYLSREAVSDEPGKDKTLKYLFKHASVEELEQYQFAEEIFKRGYYVKAITEYTRLLYKFPKGVLIEFVSLRIGDAYYEDGMNKFASAKEDKNQKKKEEAIKKFNESKTLFEKAKDQYQRVKIKFSGGEFNDRAQFYIALSQNMIAKTQFEIDDYELSVKEEIPLTNFEDAIIEYLKVIVSYKTSEYCDNARLNIGLFYKEIADYMLTKERSVQKTIEYYNKAFAELDGTVNNYPGTDACGYALYNKAIIYDRVRFMRNFQKAVDNYEKLYQEYNSYPFDENLRNLANGVKNRMDEIKREYL